MKIRAAGKFSRTNLLAYGSLLILLLVTIYCAWYVNYYLSGNSDDLVYPYLFQHFHFHDIILPGQHSNIFKFPVFILQAIIPYTFTTFTMVSIGLFLAAIFGWVAVLIWVFGKKYIPHICATLSAILLGSQIFSQDLLGTTIRNVEFPLALVFVICVSKLLKTRSLSRNQYFVGAIIGVLYSMVMAGDSFFLYTVTVATILMLAYYWYIRTLGNTVAIRASLYALGFTLLAFMIRLVVKHAGIAFLYTADVFKPHTLPVNHLGPSIVTALQQILSLFGADIFDQAITLSNALVFVNFLLLVLAFCGAGYLLFDTLGHRRHKDLVSKLGLEKTYVLGAAALSFLLTYAVYVVSDLVVVQSSNGQIQSAMQERYLEIMPLLLVLTLVYLVWRNFSSRALVLIGIPVLIGVAVLLNLKGILDAHQYNDSLRSDEIAVSQVAQKNHISFIVTGYWYGASIKFWSHGKISFATVAGCNIPQPSFNNRLSWYKPDFNLHTSALVVARQGPDASYSLCSDQQLKSIYGEPSSIIRVPTADYQTLWIYNYDLRTKIVPIQY